MPRVTYEVEYTDEFDEWWDTLTVEEQQKLEAAVDLLQSRGPAVGRPLVDHITSSKLQNMKELRPSASNLRVLFAFGPVRAAILLLGGDKTGQWEAWYKQAIPKAEQLYEEYLEELRRERLIDGT